jgi:glyoxylase-like metal-dependent hydrolase (beta-lactamase superfamily II)
VYKVACHTRGHVVYHLRKGEADHELENQVKNPMETSEGKKIRVFEESECAFSGDTLFCGGVGKFFEGNAT